MIKNAPEWSNDDVAKLFELTHKLEWTQLSKDVLLKSVLTAATVAELTEKTVYLRGLVEWYEKEWAKFDIKKFKEKNAKHISKDLETFAKQFNVDLNTGSAGSTTTPETTSTSTTNAPVEKSYEKMTWAEKQAKLNEIMNSLKGSLKMIQNPQWQYEVNLTGVQYDQIMIVYKMGGATAGYEAAWIQPKVAPWLWKVNRLNNKAERLRARGKLEKAAKFKKKAFEEAKDVAKTTKELAAYSMGTAEQKNKTEHFAELTNQVEWYASENGYNGMSIDVVPYAPLFPDICNQIGREQIRWFWYIDTASHGRVMINCPDRLVSSAQTYMRQSFQNNEPGLYNACQQNTGWVLWKDNILSRLFEKTNMSKEQAQTNSTLLFAGVWTFALLWVLRWIRTGKFEKEKKEDKWYDRVGQILLWWIGLNMFSQWMNGRWLIENWSAFLSGKMKLSDLWTKQWPESSCYAPLDCTKYCLKNIPCSMLATCCNKQSNGEAKIDFSKLEALLTTMIANEKDPVKKKALEDQLAYIKLMANDPKWQEYLNQWLANLWLNYEKLAKTDESIDATAEAARLRQIALDKYMTDNKLKFADGVTWVDADIQDFIYKNKGTIEDLKAKKKFVDIGGTNTPNPSSQDLSDPFVRVESDGTKVDVDPKTVLDKALWWVDLPLAKKLYEGQQNLAKKSIPLEFKIDKTTWIMLVSSVEMLTPIMYKNGGWYVWGESSWRGTDTFSTRFENAEQALRVAHLTNRLIHEYSGKYKINKPFSASGENKDLMVWESGTLWQKFKDTQALESWTAKSLGGAEFARNIQWYAEYLNGIHNTNGESIWNEKWKVWYELRATYFENRLKGAKPLPPLKKEDEFVPGKKTPDKDNTSPDKNNSNPKDKIDVNDPTKVLNDKNPEFIAEDIALWDKRYEEYNHKDWGDRSWKNQVERNKTFFYIWAKAFRNNQPYFTVDAYGTIGKSKGVKYGIIYERQVNNVDKKKDDAPKRIKLQQWWYGHKEKANEKPQ
jgi:hypothetical protein